MVFVSPRSIAFEKKKNCHKCWRAGRTPSRLVWPQLWFPQISRSPWPGITMHLYWICPQTLRLNHNDLNEDKCRGNGEGEGEVWVRMLSQPHLWQLCKEIWLKIPTWCTISSKGNGKYKDNTNRCGRKQENRQWDQEYVVMESWQLSKKPAQI